MWGHERGNVYHSSVIKKTSSSNIMCEYKFQWILPCKAHKVLNVILKRTCSFCSICSLQFWIRKLVIFLTKTVYILEANSMPLHPSILFGKLQINLITQQLWEDNWNKSTYSITLQKHMARYFLKFLWSYNMGEKNIFPSHYCELFFISYGSAWVLGGFIRTYLQTK